jgi:hypothetical protein
LAGIVTIRRDPFRQIDFSIESILSLIPGWTLWEGTNCGVLRLFARRLSAVTVTGGASRVEILDGEAVRGRGIAEDEDAGAAAIQIVPVKYCPSRAYRRTDFSSRRRIASTRPSISISFVFISFVKSSRCLASFCLSSPTFSWSSRDRADSLWYSDRGTDL